MSRQLIATLTERRGVLKEQLDGVLKAPEIEKRNLTADEDAEFRRIRDEIEAVDGRVRELDEQLRADDAAAETMRRYGTARIHVTREPSTYTRSMNGPSFLRDLYNARYKDDREARGRLERNNAEREDKVKALAAEQRALSTGAGAGGELVPPLWLEEDFVKFVRPGRVAANLCRKADMPAGTDSINIPKVNSGTDVEPVNGQNTTIQETDLTTTSVASSVQTIAGGQTVSLQLIEQSPLNIDMVVLEDLGLAYAQRLDTQVLFGSGANGQVVGITTLAGTNAVAYTSNAPVVVGASPNGFYNKVVSGTAQIHTKRFLQPDTILMHPNRWGWIEAAYDASGRPLIVPGSGGPFNIPANLDDQASEGLVGRMLMLPVYADANIPTNLGTNTNQDEVVVARMSDLWLWEGTIRAEAFQQTYAQNMSVYVRLYNYVSFQPGRYPQSISVISGTGLVAPSF